MRIALPIVIGLAAVMFLVAAFQFWPQPIVYKVAKPVWENRTREFEIRVPYKVAKPGVAEELRYKTQRFSQNIKAVKFVEETREEPVTENRTLQFFAMITLGLFFVVYALTILIAFIGVLFFGKPDKEHFCTIEVQLAVIVAFASGIAASYFGIILNPGRDPQVESLLEQVTTLRDIMGSNSFASPPVPVDDMQFNPDVDPAPSATEEFKIFPPSPSPAPSQPAIPPLQPEPTRNPDPNLTKEPDFSTGV